MWIRRALVDRLTADLADARAVVAELRGRVAVFTEHTTTHRTQTAFLMARVNQLEKERAIMLRHITKLEIPIPELAAVATSGPPISQDAILNAMGSGIFEDMGDDEARRQGIGWDTSGAVDYAGQSTRTRSDHDG